MAKIELRNVSATASDAGIWITPANMMPTPIQPSVERIA